MLKYPYLCLTLSNTLKCYFFAGRYFFIRKMKIKMADRKKHVLSKIVKDFIFQNKTLLVMFYRLNKTFWYQFCNFKHFLKAENSEDSLASSCVEFSISLSCNPVSYWVTIGTKYSTMTEYSSYTSGFFFFFFTRRYSCITC